MRQHLGILIVLGVVTLGVAFVGFRALSAAGSAGSERQRDGRPRPVAVEVAPIESGTIRNIRTLSGSLEARAELSVATKVGGLIQAVHVDLGDRVERDQVIARIDDAEFVQAVAQAEAELAVREAERTRAVSDRDLAQRDYDRAQALKERGIASDSQLDGTAAALESARASLALATARVNQAEASRELARIRLSYTEVKANWTEGPDAATVAERFEEAGNTVQPGDVIISVAALDPLTAGVSVTERDYAQLRVGQPATLTTAARPGETFDAVIERIAPVFRQSSRQARVELRVENPDRALRPGMFIRLQIVLESADADVIVPAASLVTRGGKQMVFTVDEDGAHVTAHEIETGIVQYDRVQIVSPPISGRVIVLGQRLLEDGSPISINEVPEP